MEKSSKLLGSFTYMYNPFTKPLQMRCFYLLCARARDHRYIPEAAIINIVDVDTSLPFYNRSFYHSHPVGCVAFLCELMGVLALVVLDLL